LTASLGSLTDSLTQFQEVVISSIPISYFNGRIEWNSNGMVMEGERRGMCESVFKTAGEQHGMCESALIGGCACGNYVE
jgi:hypothetical protein